MARIVTIYHKDGTVTRKPEGYGGELCSQATAPYENDPSNVRISKELTDEAYQEPALTIEEVAQRQRA